MSIKNKCLLSIYKVYFINIGDVQLTFRLSDGGFGFENQLLACK